MYYYVKRFFDLFFASFAILLLSPIILVCVVILKFTGERDIFYLQERIGLQNQPFNIIKFATMLRNSSSLPGGYNTLSNDSRVTVFGAFLRKSKINELPQLINILKGDMSIIGPRPLLKIGFDRYSNNVRSKIYNVRPGLSGLGSIIFRDEQEIISEAKMNGKDIDSFYLEVINPHKGELELYYQNNISFFTDIKITIATVLVIIWPKSKFYLNWYENLPLRNF